MDKDKAGIEILELFWGKGRNLTPTEIRQKLDVILEELQTYQQNWGRRQGMFKIATIVEELVEKEKFKTSKDVQV